MAEIEQGPHIQDSLRLEEIDVNLYRAHAVDLWKPVAGRSIFGGQLVGMALVAATKTVDRSCFVNSLHSRFILPGDQSKSITFQVVRIRDGRSFILRQVSAYQNGQCIFMMLCSFHKPEISELKHQYVMPEAPSPEKIATTEDALIELKPRLPKKFHKLIELRLADPIPIDIRDPEIPSLDRSDREGGTRKLIWLKSKNKLPDDPSFHMCVAAYASDHYLLNTTLRANKIIGFASPRVSLIASLDHSMWFHEPFRADEWLLYEMESPKTIGGRGLALGRLWTRDGRLVCSCAQEGVIRVQMITKPNKL